MHYSVGQCPTGQGRTVHCREGQRRAGQGRADHISARGDSLVEPIRAGQCTAGQGSELQGKAGQGRADHTSARGDRLLQVFPLFLGLFPSLSSFGFRRLHKLFSFLFGILPCLPAFASHFPACNPSGIGQLAPLILCLLQSLPAFPLCLSKEILSPFPGFMIGLDWVIASTPTLQVALLVCPVTPSP